MLCQALTSHIDGLYEKLEYRKTVDQAEPYTLETMEPNIPGLKVNMRGWEVDHARSLKTLLNHDFPMAMTLEQMEPMMTKNILSSYRKNNHHVVPALLHKYVYCANYNNSLNLDGLLGLYYPSDLDQCAIAIFLLLQTGWNKESVLEVDGDDFEHALSGSIDESLSVVFSEKFRSQGNEQPFDAPKQMTASSNRDDPYSIHNLVLLAKELSKPMKGYQFDADPFLANGKSAMNYSCSCAAGATGSKIKAGTPPSPFRTRTFTAAKPF